ncbi:MAG: hypothetical protein ACPGU7_10230 [Gammaproteobacteria bacterium]
MVHRLALDAIERDLLELQTHFGEINAGLSASHDALTDEVIANLLDGYRFVDQQLVEGVDLLGFGQSELLLELNARVLCGTRPARREAYGDHLKATRERFYHTPFGGIDSLAEWLVNHAEDGIWHRAAGLYIQVLSRPELFLEGNHRTATLMVSALLAREGHPPFVLTARNAAAFFPPSSRAKSTQRRSLVMLFRRPRLCRQLMRLFREWSDPRHLIRPEREGRPMPWSGMGAIE